MMDLVIGITLLMVGAFIAIVSFFLGRLHERDRFVTKPFRLNDEEPWMIKRVTEDGIRVSNKRDEMS